MDLLKLTIQQKNPGILILPEANISRNEPNLHTHFEGYAIESKFFPGQDRARISVLIKENIEYERISQIEDDWISTLWIKIKISQNQSAGIVSGNI